MRSLRSISKSRARVVMLAGILLLGIGRGWAQAAPAQNLPVSDPFRSFNDSLSTAADNVLAAPVQRAIEASRSDLPLSGRTTEAVTAKASGPAQAINRVQQLRPIIEPILHEEQVPTELAAIVLVESGGEPNALSPKGARGIWQFMPDTARRYGLIVSPDHDERLDIQRSTRAAARYLRDLYAQFGDWQLAFAAYNAGEDLVQRAIARNRTSNFALLSSGRSLPSETRRYVPAVLDAMERVGNASGFVAPPRKVRATWVLYAETNMARNQDELFLEPKGEMK